MKLLMENFRKYLKESDEDVSDTLFFVKSSWGKEKNKWDHVGFILKDGRMKDMSGHRGEMVNPVTSTWKEMRQDSALEHIPENPEEAEKQGLYKKIKLEKEVVVPDGIICRIDDPKKKAENCGSFVFNVLYNGGIDPDFLKGEEYAVVGKTF